MRLVCLALVALCFSAAAAFAAGIPVKVTADTFTVDQAAHLATFTGNVVITRSDMSMWAEKVVVHYGTGDNSDIDSLEATGGVRIKTPEQEATGRRATFDPDTSVLRLIDDVTVTSAKGTVNGPELTINLANNTSVLKGSGGGRVTGVFTPQ